MTNTEKAYFRALEAVSGALKIAQERPELLCSSFKKCPPEELKGSMEALEHLCKLSMDVSIAETKRHIT